MTFLRHPSFPSDAVLTMVTVQASLSVMDAQGAVFVMSMDVFVAMTIEEWQSRGLVILSASFFEPPSPSSSSSPSPSLSAEIFRVAQRTKNSHAHVNAGMYSIHLVHSPTI